MLIQLDVPEMPEAALESFLEFASRYAKAVAQDSVEVKGLTRTQLIAVEQECNAALAAEGI